MMNESQDSNRDNYDNSGPLLNELIQLALDSGSLGSKLSGAGWGGFCIHLVKKDNVDDFLSKIKTYYTKKRENGK